jgi:hypothetical protein
MKYLKQRLSSFILPLALAAALLALADSLAFGHEALTKAAPIAATSLEAVQAPAPQAAEGSGSEAQDYGRRQSLNPALSEFAGGHDEEVIIVGSCGCILIVAIILILIVL